jgi:hypothetical protein
MVGCCANLGLIVWILVGNSLMYVNLMFCRLIFGHAFSIICMKITDTL